MTRNGTTLPFLPFTGQQKILIKMMAVMETGK
jgi:hypothetical protein